MCPPERGRSDPLTVPVTPGRPAQENPAAFILDIAPRPVTPPVIRAVLHT
ncbi:hypothetical protein GDO78_014652 [Eleutherodactylus coqui]|uniref:Uncharacterized protein n=1 Tax=Eleutherodactylus coqui TaxID=57060 RepID=A0A8J6EEL0_ELECQ|nr:hypothetical protein GDO78_014652 [Eleutherodactylus coqui]